MKTQTAEESLALKFMKCKDAKNQYYVLPIVDDADQLVKIALDHTTTQIEALRERLIKNAPSVLAGISIERTINEFLKEINDEKRNGK